MLGTDTTPRIAGMADAGVRAAWMKPSYPVLTFPNHYTLVTGLRPDHHGVVHNTMEDAALGRFSHGSEVSDAPWWDGGLPVWVSAERAGLPTATYFWPGSDAVIHGVRPTRWKPYSEDTTPYEQADTSTISTASDRPRSRRPSSRCPMAASTARMAARASAERGPWSCDA